MRLAAKGLTAILSIITVGAALSLTTPLAFAGDDNNSKNVTEDEIVRALAPPPKKPLTPRPLDRPAGRTRTQCGGNQADPVRARPLDALAFVDRARRDRVGGQGQAEHRS
ncbi:hypothetical protein ABIF44_005929 [Bradyrhizobium japonicum]